MPKRVYIAAFLVIGCFLATSCTRRVHLNHGGIYSGFQFKIENQVKEKAPVGGKEVSIMYKAPLRWTWRRVWLYNHDVWMLQNKIKSLAPNAYIKEMHTESIYWLVLPFNSLRVEATVILSGDEVDALPRYSVVFSKRKGVTDPKKLGKKEYKYYKKRIIGTDTH